MDPWAGAAADPWAIAEPPAQAVQPEQPGWDFDVFNKGKGKGSGDRGPLQCYNCLGEGHPQFLCASGTGARKADLGPICGNCKGKGHDAAACTSKGGGKHVPKGKGNGAQPNIFGGKGWGKGGKGKGRAKATSRMLMRPDGRTWAPEPSGTGQQFQSGQQQPRPHPSGSLQPPVRPLQPPGRKLHQRLPHLPGWWRPSSQRGP